MNERTDENYLLALSILNAMVGQCFDALHTERAKEANDPTVVEQFKQRFQTFYAQREGLGLANDEQLQKVIDEIGPEVRSAVEAVRQKSSTE